MKKNMENDIKENICQEDFVYVSKYIYELNKEVEKLDNQLKKLKKDYIDLENKYNSLSKSKLVKIAYRITRLKRKVL